MNKQKTDKDKNNQMHSQNKIHNEHLKAINKICNYKKLNIMEHKTDTNILLMTDTKKLNSSSMTEHKTGVNISKFCVILSLFSQVCVFFTLVYHFLWILFISLWLTVFFFHKLFTFFASFWLFVSFFNRFVTFLLVYYFLYILSQVCDILWHFLEVCYTFWHFFTSLWPLFY